MAGLDTISIENQTENSGTAPQNGALLAYVDGSFRPEPARYAFGCVFLPESGEIRIAYGNGSEPESLKQRNVAGEMLGAMYAVRVAMMSGYQAVTLCYDYEGLEKWVTGAWRSKTELTRKYAEAMRRWGRTIRISFRKVAAHTKVEYNELADKIAKKGLTDGNGVPKIRPLEELEIYEG